METSRRIKVVDVIDLLSNLLILRGVPGHIRSGDGPKYVAKAVQAWIAAAVAKMACITPFIMTQPGKSALLEVQHRVSAQTGTDPTLNRRQLVDPTLRDHGAGSRSRAG